MAQKTILKEYPGNKFEDLIISSFNGNILINNSLNDQLEIKIISKPKTFPKGFSVEVLESDGFLALFLRTPCTISNELIEFDRNNPFYSFTNQNHETIDCKMDMDPFRDFPELQIEIFLPASVKLYASLINGKINIQDSESEIMASNVMGDILMKNVSQVREAKTVNGNINIHFSNAPHFDAEFATINGDIDIQLLKSTNLHARFKSFSGDLFTDFENTTIQKQKIAKTKDIDDTLSLKSNDFTVVKVGNGGINFTMETIHGNAYLKAI